MNLTIRAFDPKNDADYDAWTTMKNAAMPEYTSAAAEMKSGDERLDSRCVRLRWIGELDGKVVGGASCGQIAWAFDPDRYDMSITVHPDHERKGFGGALYHHLLDVLKDRNAQAMLAYAREDHPRALRFALNRGFVEMMREWDSRLDVAAFDPTPWAEARSRPAAHGIVLKSYAELADDPNRDQKVYELEIETGRDVPTTEEHNDMPYDSYRQMVLDSPNLLPDAFIVAVEEATGKYVASSNLWKREADTELQTGLTAVRRDYRRKGIALAMKLRVIEYAQRVGAPSIRTENASTNRPMLSINEALGFVKKPAWVSLAHELRPKVAASKTESETGILTA